MDEYFKKLCCNIIQDEGVAGVSIAIPNELNCLVVLVETIVSYVVNKKMFLKSLQISEAENLKVNELEKIRKYIERSSKMFNDVCINSTCKKNNDFFPVLQK
jgi:hypothetical protein